MIGAKKQSGGHSEIEYIAVTYVVLKDMVADIVGAVHPEKIVLFGSRARGESNRDSDVDLLIVVRDFEAATRQQLLSKVRNGLFDYLVPIDLVLYAQGELSRFSEWKNHVVRTALDEGRVLYERQSTS